MNFQFYDKIFFSKLHSKSGTVLAVKGVPMVNCIVNHYRNATFNETNITFLISYFNLKLGFYRTFN